jgi:hypothetical protein
MDWERFAALTQRQRDLSRRLRVVEQAIMSDVPTDRFYYTYGEQKHLSYALLRHHRCLDDGRYRRLLRQHAACLEEQVRLSRAEFPELPRLSFTLAFRNHVDRERLVAMNDADLRALYGIGQAKACEIRARFPSS